MARAVFRDFIEQILFFVAFSVPGSAYVAGFSITFDGKETYDIDFSDIREGQTYFVEEDETSDDHIHLFIDDECGCGKEYNDMGEMPLIYCECGGEQGENISNAISIQSTKT